MSLLTQLKRIWVILTTRNVDKAREAEIDAFGGGMTKPMKDVTKKP